MHGTSGQTLMKRNSLRRSNLFRSLPLLWLAAPALGEVPIEIAATGHATVPVQGAFGTRQFVFDTGAEGTAVYEDFAESAALPGIGTTSLQGQTGSSEVSLVRLSELKLDGVSKADIEAVKLPRRADGVPLAGIVGLDVFGDRTV